MTDHTQEKRSVPARFAGDVAHMPLWQKLLLGVAVLVAIAGVAGQVYSRLTPPPSPARVTSETDISTPPPGGRSFVGGSPQAPAAPAETAAPTPEPSLVAQYAPTLTKMGISFIGSFIIGWAFRVFIKTMVLATIALAGVLFALSYFNVMNVDFTAAGQQYSSVAGWLWDQATRVKDLATSYLPASSAGVAGLIVGLKKK